MARFSMLVPFLLAATAAGTLAGCRSEESIKADYRAEKSRECLDTLRQEPNAALLDADRFCGCVLDRQMAGRSAGDLQSFVPTAAQKQEWGVRCADASLRPGALKPVAAPAPAPAMGGRDAAREAPKGER